MQFERAASLAAAAAVMLAASAHAQWREWDSEFDEGKKTWQEIQAQIPAFPKPDALVRVPTETATPHQFFVDTRSITLGEDEVMRFTVVAKTAGGATNVTYEGMRCETQQRKLYAIGRSDGTWVRARDTQWHKVLLRDLTPHHHALYHQFFCNERTRPTAVRIAIDALKRGEGLNPGSRTD